MNTVEPLVRAEVDCTDLDGFMLNAERLMASELVALSSHEVIGAALLLWCRAWKQRPAASLPNDEKVIAAFARMPLARFRKLRSELLRGFVLCSDGRLYHRTLAVEAANAYERKTAFQRKREADAERLRKWRVGTRSETTHETLGETRFVAKGQGQGQGQGQGHIHSVPDGTVVKTTQRGSRLPKPWALPKAWGEAALADHAHWTADIVRRIAADFADHWHAKAGKDATKVDWEATWRKWYRSDITQRAHPPPGSASAETAYQRSMRERMEQVAPSIAAKHPGSLPAPNPMEVLDGLTRLAG